MPLDREQARQALLDIGVFDDGWDVSQPTVTEVLDAIEACVTPRLAEVDVRLVGEAEAKLARIRKAIDELDADSDPSAWADGRSAVTDRVRTILDGPTA